MRSRVTLFINNDDVAKVLTMADTIEALERAYSDIAAKEAVCRPRIDIRIPTSDPAKNYQFGSMEGGSTAGYFAVRMKSDVVYETTYNGARTQEKYCSKPGLFCGLVLLTSLSELTVSSILYSADSNTIGVVIFGFEQAGYSNLSTAASTVVLLIYAAVGAAGYTLQRLLRRRIGTR